MRVQSLGLLFFWLNRHLSIQSSTLNFSAAEFLPNLKVDLDALNIISSHDSTPEQHLGGLDCFCTTHRHTDRHTAHATPSEPMARI